MNLACKDLLQKYLFLSISEVYPNGISCLLLRIISSDTYTSWIDRGSFLTKYSNESKIVVFPSVREHGVKNKIK